MLGWFNIKYQENITYGNHNTYRNKGTIPKHIAISNHTKGVKMGDGIVWDWIRYIIIAVAMNQLPCTVINLMFMMQPLV